MGSDSYGSGNTSSGMGGDSYGSGNTRSGMGSDTYGSGTTSSGVGSDSYGSGTTSSAGHGNKSSGESGGGKFTRSSSYLPNGQIANWEI